MLTVTPEKLEYWGSFGDYCKISIFSFATISETTGAVTGLLFTNVRIAHMVEMHRVIYYKQCLMSHDMSARTRACVCVCNYTTQSYMHG